MEMGKRGGGAGCRRTPSVTPAEQRAATPTAQPQQKTKPPRGSRARARNKSQKMDDPSPLQPKNFLRPLYHAQCGTAHRTHVSSKRIQGIQKRFLSLHAPPRQASFPPTPSKAQKRRNTFLQAHPSSSSALQPIQPQKQTVPKRSPDPLGGRS